MAKLKVVLHPKIDRKGKKQYRLAFRVTAYRRRSYLYLGYDIDPNDWNEEFEKVRKTHAKHQLLNRLIRKKYDQIDDIIFEAASKNEKITASQILDKVRDKLDDTTFYALAEEHIEDLKQAKKLNRAISDRSKLNRIKEFSKKKTLNFHEVDELFLRRLKTYLLTKRHVSERTVMNLFVFVRLIFNEAIRRGLVDYKLYPFGKGKIQIKYPPTLKIGLNEEEILKLEELELQPETQLWQSRNIFLFSFYLAGMRISDVLNLRWNNIVDQRLTYKMRKNNKLDSIKIPEKASEILEMYRHDQKSSSDLIFPYLKGIQRSSSKIEYNTTKSSIKKINKYLKELATKAGVDKKITSHIARHSFGNIAGDKVSPQMLQKLYRHSHLSTTIGYQGNFIHATSDNALEEILKFSTTKI